MENQLIETIKKLLKDKPRDRLLFEMAIRTGLRFNDLILLKVAEVSDLAPGQAIYSSSGNWTYPHSAVMTAGLKGYLDQYLDQVDAGPGDYLFKSRKGDKPLAQTSVSHLINGWFKQAGLGDLPAAKSLRRAWEETYRPTSFEAQAADDGAVSGLEALQPVKATTLKETVYRELLGAVLSGRIRPGENLIAEQIADRLGVSPMPVREALHILEAQGFVATQSRKGRIVNRLSRKDLEEVLELRLQLESQAAAAGAERLTPEVMARLRRLHREYLEGSNEIELFRINKEFHHLIYAQANQPILMELIEILWNKISPYLHIFARYSWPEGMERSRRCHQRVLAALEAGDAAGVADWIRRDLKEAADLIGLKLVEDRPSAEK